APVAPEEPVMRSAEPEAATPAPAPQPVPVVEAATPAEASAPEPMTSAPAPLPEPGVQLPVPHAADAASVDVAMLRRSWGSLVQHLGQGNQPVLRALMESATPAAYDGATLELAFPPTFRNT